VVTLLPEEDVGAVTPEDDARDEDVSDEELVADVPDDVPDDVVADWAVPDDAVTWAVAGVAAGDEFAAANPAVPAVTAMATPAMPAVMRLTRRRARCRRVTASLGLGTASRMGFSCMGTSVDVRLWCTLDRRCEAAVNSRSSCIPYATSSTVTTVSRTHAVERIEHAIGELIRLSSSQRVHAERLRATGLRISSTEFRFLRTIGSYDPLSVSRIAVILGVSQPTASRTLRNLETQGLVSRASVASDGRVAAYGITERGRGVQRQLEDHMHEQLINALGDVPDDKRTELARQLEDLVGRLKNAPAPTSAALATTPPTSASRIATQ
jgi:DNA-binding MarR family transcriptional regulator